MKSGTHILLVEDEPDLRTMTQSFLIRKGFHVVAAASKEEAFTQLTNHKFDAYILDIMLPQEDGYDIASRIRENQLQAPILFLTALHDIDHKLKAFDALGDDYLTKPFELKELDARIHALLRRQNAGTLPQEEAITVGLVELSLNSNTLKIGDRTYQPQPTTCKVLNCLMENEKKVVPRYFLLEKIWKENTQKTNANLDVHLHAIRKILNDFSNLKLETIRGIGVRLVLTE